MMDATTSSATRGGEVEDPVGEPQVRDVRAESVAVVVVHRPEAEADESHGEVSHLRKYAVHEASVRGDAGADPGPALGDGGHLRADGGLHHEAPRVPPSPRVQAVEVGRLGGGSPLVEADPLERKGGLAGAVAREGLVQGNAGDELPVL